MKKQYFLASLLILPIVSFSYVGPAMKCHLAGGIMDEKDIRFQNLRRFGPKLCRFKYYGNPRSPMYGKIRFIGLSGKTFKLGPVEKEEYFEARGCGMVDQGCKDKIVREQLE